MQELQEFRSCRSSGVAGVQDLQEFRSSARWAQLFGLGGPGHSKSDAAAEIRSSRTSASSLSNGFER